MNFLTERKKAIKRDGNSNKVKLDFKTVIYSVQNTEREKLQPFASIYDRIRVFSHSKLPFVFKFSFTLTRSLTLALVYICAHEQHRLIEKIFTSSKRELRVELKLNFALCFIKLFSISLKCVHPIK